MKHKMTKEETIEILKNAAWLGTNEDRVKTEEAVAIAIQALEDIVRCKDCRWWKHNSCEGGLIDAYMQIDPEKFYCAHGERRTDENT